MSYSSIILIYLIWCVVVLNKTYILASKVASSFLFYYPCIGMSVTYKLITWCKKSMYNTYIICIFARILYTYTIVWHLSSEKCVYWLTSSMSSIKFNITLFIHWYRYQAWLMALACSRLHIRMLSASTFGVLLVFCLLVTCDTPTFE